MKRRMSLPPLHVIGRIKGANGRQRSPIFLALDHRHLTAAALRQPRCADVAGEHVWIAMDAERMFCRTRLRIVPGAGGQLQHARHDVVCNGGGSQTRAAIVEQADDVAIGDAAVRRIDRIETDDFPAGNFSSTGCRHRSRADCAAGSPAGWRSASTGGANLAARSTAAMPGAADNRRSRSRRWCSNRSRFCRLASAVCC